MLLGRETFALRGDDGVEQRWRVVAATLWGLGGAQVKTVDRIGEDSGG